MAGKKVNKFGNNILWTASIQAIRVAVQVLTIGVLSRIIPAAEYGAMAACFVVINLAYVFRDGGVTASLIRIGALSKKVSDTAFLISISLGVIIFLVLQNTYNEVEYFFEIYGVGELVGIVSWAFIFSGFGAVPQALLERSCNFKKIAQAEIFSSVIAFTFALILATKGFGAKSLAFSFLINVSLTSLMYIFLAKWRPGFSWDKESFREVFGFGGGVLGFNFINYIARNADVPIISRSLGAIQVGYYSQAYKIMLFPVQNITGAINRGLYPELCARIRDGKSADLIYCKILRALSFCVWPLMMFVAAESESIVYVVLGKSWLSAAPVLFWLALTGCIQALVSTTGGALQAIGRIHELIKLGIFATLLQVTAFFFGVSGGIDFVAKMYFLANLVNGIFALYFTCKLIGAKISKISLDLLLNFIVSSFVVICSHCFVNKFLSGDIGFVRLLVFVFAFFVIFFLLITIIVLFDVSNRSLTNKIIYWLKLIISGNSITSVWKELK